MKYDFWCEIHDGVSKSLFFSRIEFFWTGLGILVSLIVEDKWFNASSVNCSLSFSTPTGTRTEGE